jgi:hypothetical protein
MEQVNDFPHRWNVIPASRRAQIADEQPQISTRASTCGHT